MKLTIQRRLAASIMKCSPKKVRFDTKELSDIKESITKADIRNLVSDKVITKKKNTEQSRGRAREILKQKRKGRRKGVGSRKGTRNARSSDKETWMNTIRNIRELLKALRDKKALTTTTYQSLLRKAKGGFFRNKRHVKLYLEEHNLIEKAK